MLSYYLVVMLVGLQFFSICMFGFFSIVLSGEEPFYGNADNKPLLLLLLNICSSVIGTKREDLLFLFGGE